MKVDLDQKLKNFDGSVVKNGETELDLKTVVVASLGTPLEDDKGLSADKAVSRWKLAVKLYSGGEQEITPEEATEIRNRIPKCYAVMVAGQACEMLK